MYALDIHGDDYAVSPNNSKRMIELMHSGRLDSISIIANMGCFDECMDMLNHEWDSIEHKPKISVHLNLIDGCHLSGNGYIRGSWGKLFIKSLIPGKAREKLRVQVYEEIKAQIIRVREATPYQDELRVDSHVHTHMIPLVFEAMTDAIKDLKLEDKLTYIRLPREPFFMFFTTKGVRGTFPKVNILKNLILNYLGARAERYCQLNGLEKNMMWGLMMTGYMDEERVNILLPKMLKKARKKDAHLEVNCHPGIALREELRPEYGPDDLQVFFSSDRDTEYNMIMNVKKEA